MGAKHSQTFTVPGDAATVFPALIEASRRAGGNLFVHQQAWTVRIEKGLNLLTFGNNATSRVVASQGRQTTIEIVAEIPAALFDAFGVNKRYANAIRGHLLQLLQPAPVNPQHVGHQPTSPPQF